MADDVLDINEISLLSGLNNICKISCDYPGFVIVEEVPFYMR